MNERKEEYISLTEFSSRFHVSRTTVYRWMREGMPKLQPAGPGGKLWFPYNECLAWLKGRERRIKEDLEV